VPFGLNPSSFDSSGQKPCEQLGTWPTILLLIS
jgi:hypothetical protein